MFQISGKTKTIALIGTPVEHSLSPAMHTFSFEHLGIDCVYLAYDVQPEQLEAAVAGMKALGFAGYNVTMPHKTRIPALLDGLSDAAELMGAVNTVVIKDNKAIGHNTDGAGFMRSVKEAGVDVKGKKMTLLGAGGAASAIYVQAALDGVAAIDVFKRKNATFEEAEKRIAKIAKQTGCDLRLLPLDDQEALKRSLAESALLVNATNVGMGESAGQSIVPADYLVEGLAVADTIYNPRKTKLMQDAEAKGLKVISGLGMLLWQAAIAEQIWVGKEMPTKLVEEKFFD